MSQPRRSVKVGHDRTLLTGRRNRQETMLSIRKNKKDEARVARRHQNNRNTQFNDAASRHELLQNLASRSNALLVGLAHKDIETRRKSMRTFVFLLSSGVPPLFDDTDSQHEGLWNTIIQALPSFVEILQLPHDSNEILRYKADAAFALRFVSSMDKASLVLQCGAVPHLVQLLQCNVPELQIQAAWCLGNVASESAECCQQILNVCPVIQLLPILQHPVSPLRRAIVWLLRSVVDFPEITENETWFNLETKQEILENLVVLCQQISSIRLTLYLASQGIPHTNGEPIDCRQLIQPVGAIAPWRIFEYQTGKPSPNDIAVVRFLRDIDELMVEVVDVDVNFETGHNSVFEAKRSDLKPMAVMGDTVGDDDDVDDNNMQEDDGHDTGSLDEQILTLCDACWTLVEITVRDKNNQLLSAIVSSGLCAQLVYLLCISRSSVVLAPILRLLGNIISADVSFSQALLDAQLLQAMPAVMRHTSRAVREEACWMLSNIAGGSTEQMATIMATPGLIQALIEQMAWAEHGVRREATWAICNVLVGTPNDECLVAIVDMGALQFFVPMLEEWEDPMIELVILEAIEALLVKSQGQMRVQIEESGCLSKLESLCYSENNEVGTMASQIMDTWFGSDKMKDEDNSNQPAVISTGENSEVLQFQPTNDNVEFNFN